MSCVFIDETYLGIINIGTLVEDLHSKNKGLGLEFNWVNYTPYSFTSKVTSDNPFYQEPNVFFPIDNLATPLEGKVATQSVINNGFYYYDENNNRKMGAFSGSFLKKTVCAYSVQTEPPNRGIVYHRFLDLFY